LASIVYTENDTKPIALMMEAESTFETPVNLFQSTWRNSPEDSHLLAVLCSD
jgi:hypothetical protein